MQNSREKEMMICGYPVRVVRSGRKTACLSLTPEGELIARGPYRMTDAAFRKMVEANLSWIQTHLDKQKKLKAEAEKRGTPSLLNPDEIKALAAQAARVLSSKTAQYARIMGVTYGRITIRNQKTRWGSCSAKGNLNFNCLLMLAPDSVQNYVVVHELCHRKQMNHSPAFWAEVEKIMPDYLEQRKWLRDHGGELMQRMHGL